MGESLPRYEPLFGLIIVACLIGIVASVASWHESKSVPPARILESPAHDTILDCHATVRLTEQGPQISVHGCEPSADGGAL